MYILHTLDFKVYLPFFSKGFNYTPYWALKLRIKEEEKIYFISLWDQQCMEVTLLLSLLDTKASLPL